MQNNLHPTWHPDAKVTCACGNTFTTGSTVDAIQVDICSKCHPFFTGEMKFVDRQGRVDKFMQKMQAAQARQAQQKAKQDAKKKTGAVSNEPVKSYQELLRDQQTRLKESKKASQVA